MKLKLTQPCPQCGAPVTLWESDRLLTCSYCGVKSYLCVAGPFRYRLPPGPGGNSGAHVFHVPYLRFKGAAYRIDRNGMHHRLIDTTQLASSLDALSPSLGLRPQAMTLQRITLQTRGSFLACRDRVRTILDRVLEQSGFGPPGDNGFQAFIGETVSIIYLPVLETDSLLVDGVTGRRLGRVPAGEDFRLVSRSFQKAWQPRFLPALCPRCGWNLDGEADTAVVLCTNCLSAFQVTTDRFQEVVWQVAAGQGTIYLPFWRLACHFPVFGLSSFADLVRETNQPVVVRPQWQELELRFWVPAFKLRPEIFLRAGQQVTMRQWHLELAGRSPRENLYPVTLPADEAKQAVKLILAGATVQKKKRLSLLATPLVHRGDPELVYLPCLDGRHDWVQEETGAVIAKAVLRFGRRL